MFPESNIGDHYEKQEEILICALTYERQTSLLIVTPIVGFCNCCMFCCALLCGHSILAIISWDRERADTFALIVFLVSRDCCVALSHDSTGCLQLVIVVFTDHTHLLFFTIDRSTNQLLKI